MTTGTATPYGSLALVTAVARYGSNRPASGDARAASERPVPGFTPRQPRARPGPIVRASARRGEQVSDGYHDEDEDVIGTQATQVQMLLPGGDLGASRLA
jgi:hypothetical protein